MHSATVIIPTHNRPHYLREALRSVIAQDDVDLDIIVVGDGVGADTHAVVEEFPGVRFLSQAQAGPMAARNNAMSVARCEYIALLDDDDVWLPWKMKAQLAMLERHPEAAFVFSDFFIMREGQPLIPNGLATYGLTDHDWTSFFQDQIEDDPPCFRVRLYDVLLSAPCVLPTTAVFRASLYGGEIRFVDHDPICGDWEFFARLSRTHPAIYMSAESACNRSHESLGRLTRTPAPIQLQRRLDMIGRLWATDADYLASESGHRRVTDVQLRYLVDLAKYQIRESDVSEVRRTFDRIEELGQRLHGNMRLLRELVRIPGMVHVVRAADRLMCRARGRHRH